MLQTCDGRGYKKNRKWTYNSDTVGCISIKFYIVKGKNVNNYFWNLNLTSFEKMNRFFFIFWWKCIEKRTVMHWSPEISLVRNNVITLNRLDDINRCLRIILSVFCPSKILYSKFARTLRSQIKISKKNTK